MDDELNASAQLHVDGVGEAEVGQLQVAVEHMNAAGEIRVLGGDFHEDLHGGRVRIELESTLKSPP